MMQSQAGQEGQRELHITKGCILDDQLREREQLVAERVSFSRSLISQMTRRDVTTTTTTTMTATTMMMTTAAPTPIPDDRSTRPGGADVFAQHNKRYEKVPPEFMRNGRLCLRRQRQPTTDDDDPMLVRAPHIDATMLRRAERILPYFAAHPSRTRMHLIGELKANLEAVIDVQYGGNKLMNLAYLAMRYAPSTALNYALYMQAQDDSLYHDPNWRNGVLQLKRYAAENRPTAAATPATPQQVRRLIGNLSRPEQRAVYQLWVSASRFGESIGETDPEAETEEGHTPRTWILQRHPEHNVLELYLPTHKAGTTFDKPYSKWIELGSNPRQHEKFWEPHRIDYRRMLSYVKSIFPELSMHSFRKGSIRHLEQLGFPEWMIARLSGHSPSGRFTAMQRSYLANSPNQPGARDIMVLTRTLRQAIGQCI